MPVTSAQIDSTLRIKKEFNLITGAGLLTDLTNWNGLGVITPDTAKVLLWLVDPTGATVYINSGFDTDNYSSPDFTLSTTTKSFTVPTDVNSEYITGTYTLYIKAQVVDNISNGSISLYNAQAPAVGVPQIDDIYINGTPNVGDTCSATYNGVTISYTAQIGDTNILMAQGLYNAISAYQIANPSSDWAVDLLAIYFAPNNSIEIDATANNTPFTLTLSYQHSGVAVGGSSESTAVVCQCDGTATASVDVDYATALITVTDTTAYGAYSSITRANTIYPPPLSGLPNQTTSATTNVYSNIVTTTWSWKIVSDVTYLNANDTYTTCRWTGQDEFLVEADTLCNTLCLIKKFRTEFYSKYGKKCVDDMEKAYNLAMDEFYLAFMATRCGRPQSEIQGYINKIYEITGLDPDCDCGCNVGEYPTPVVPTSIINGTDGTDGVTPQFQNTGTWIQVSYDSGNTWNNLFSLASVTGAAGANGTNGTDGADGVAVMYNEFPAQATTTNSTWETLETYTVPAAQLDSNGSDLEILATFTTSSWTSAAQNTRITFNGSTIISPSIYAGFYARPITKIVISARITRTSNTTAKTQVSVEFVTSGYDVVKKLTQPILGLAGLNFTTTTYDIDADAYSAVNGDITLENLEIIYYKK